MLQTVPYLQTEDFKPILQGTKKVFDYLMSPELQSALFPLKIIFIFLSLFFLFAVFYFLTHTEYIGWKVSFGIKNVLFPKAVSSRKLARKWKKIKRDLEKGEFESQWKISLIEGLNLFDKQLEKIGYSGKNLLEKINKVSPEDVSNLEEVVKAERICEDVVRDPDYHLTKEQAQEVIDAFEKTLRDLQVL